MKKLYVNPLIRIISVNTTGHTLEGGSIVVEVHEDETYDGTAASNWNGKYSIWKDEEED